MPESLRLLAKGQQGQLRDFFDTPYSEWNAARELREGYRERFALYLEELTPEGQKGAFALAFELVRRHAYGLADRYYEPLGIPDGYAHMPPPVQESLTVLSGLAPLEWNAEELDWMLSNRPYSRYIYPSWRQAFHGPLVSLEPTERRKIPAATRQMEAILLAELRDGPGLPLEVRELDEVLLADDFESGRIPLQYVSDADDFGPSVRDAVSAVMPEYQAARLLLFMNELTALKPTAKWKRAAASRLTEQPEAVQVAQVLLGLAAERRPTADLGEISCVTQHLGSVLRASFWLLALQNDAPAHIALIRDAAAYLGAGHNGRNGVCRSTTGANAGVEVLLEIAGSHPDSITEVVGALTRIRDVVKNKNLHKRLVNVVDQLSAEQGIAPSELLETAIPNLGFTEEGTKTFLSDGYTATLSLTYGSSGPGVELAWFDANGEPLITPAQRRKAPKAAAVKLAVSEAKKAVASQRRRIERLMASERAWTGAEFRTRYLEHPVVGTTARNLLWTITGKEVVFSGYPRPSGNAAGWELVGLEGESRAIPAEAGVILWKPWERDVEEVRAWRSHQRAHQLMQPFRQVYRELYLLTPAEKETGHYSNRFAGHVLDYPRAMALMKDRDWHGAQLGSWDGGQDTQLYVDFPDDRLRAGFSIELLESGEERATLCSTNRVWFERQVARDTWESMDLEEVPRAVFSEAMRDVDLFTAVAAIGPDPGWADHPNGNVRDYWGASHKAALSESAQTRREYLSEILPRTILSQCSRLSDRHLIVQGKHRSYKIHLGSGNILMDPDDSYLCIVQAPGSPGQRIFLPFEEKAGRLATILSKAFMLMNDHKITDPSILSQIHRTR
ncbi:DUF4132 domain-containing protein [Paenarthrobacter aurescens]|nr:DUF4132 domain-containing protein [Paenarthrobacter aurescens]MDO6142286.1 DUF4132 domain-containing protein [Paenarthrobacter aurescens]MDO6146133.1 DUF4132 domain-containing protein [Paenarthrobacter aurescens]MDO6157378.1 DUF4132 domain-containing protein [Paenarthrobacter aurescens]MDO6161363.1 DUF4132 domain-containing protein [Paenarthrobacter aurescens]